MVMADDLSMAILGVGPGLSRAVAVRFAGEGFRVALMGRDPAHLAPVGDAVREAGGEPLEVATDATQPESVTQAFAQLRATWGDPQVLVYNAGLFRAGGLLELEPDWFEQCWRANCMGAFLAAREVLPAMVERGKGTVLLSGATAALRGGARFAGLAVGKFGLRALAQSMAREFGPQGVHVAHVVIDGQIGTPRNRQATPDRPQREFLSPEAIAETYWQLYLQSPTAWTLEMDVRPAVERF